MTSDPTPDPSRVRGFLHIPYMQTHTDNHGSDDRSLLATDMTPPSAGHHDPLDVAARAMIEALRCTLQTGGRVYLIVAEGGATSTNEAVTTPRYEPAQGQLVSPVSAPDLKSTAACSQPSERRQHEAAVSYLQRIRRTHGAVEFKLREWAGVLDLTIAEMERAIKHGALPCRKKPDGLDHGAIMVGVGDALAYLTTVDAVERRVMAEPLWWAAVRGGKKAA